MGGFQDDKPYSYQEVEGRRVEVATAYALEAERTPERQVYGFHVGGYDKGRPLMLDPAVLLYAGYIGGGGSDRALAIAVDGFGNTYVTGATDLKSAATFPLSVGPSLTFKASADVFVAKVNPAGTGFIYAGIIGGLGLDEGFGIAVDSAGNAYVTGATNSDQSSFPVKGGPSLTYSGGVFDAFVAKVDATGMMLDYCGYIGGAGTDGGVGIAVDASGAAYITGATTSTEVTFPVLIGPGLTYKGGFFFGDAFVAKVKADGTGLVYCGYIGGAGEDVGIGIAVDGSGNAYVAGGTNSTDLPTLVGPFLTYNGGVREAFVAKVMADGTALVYCGYIGGSGADTAFGIAVDSAGSAYVSGETFSTNFPVTVGPNLTYSGGGDAFVAKVNAAGTALVYAGYIGGSARDGATGIAVDSLGNAYVTGATASSDFHTILGPSLTFSGGPFLGDAFVAKVNPAGTALVYSGYIGGSDDELGYGIAVDATGAAYVAGETASTELTFPVTVGPKVTYNGGSRDAFVAKVPAHFYAAQVQQPINPDGTSVFNVKRGVVPVKFTLTVDGMPTCSLPPATIALMRTAGGTIGAVDESVYLQPSDTGTSFRIDTTACQYIYNLGSSSLGPGTYQVSIMIAPFMVGSGTFGLQ